MDLQGWGALFYAISDNALQRTRFTFSPGSLTSTPSTHFPQNPTLVFSPSHERPYRPSRHPLRWALVIALVVFGHLAAAGWFALHATRSPDAPTPPKVIVALLKATRVNSAGQDQARGGSTAHSAVDSDDRQATRGAADTPASGAAVTHTLQGALLVPARVAAPAPDRQPATPAHKAPIAHNASPKNEVVASASTHDTKPASAEKAASAPDTPASAGIASAAAPSSEPEAPGGPNGDHHSSASLPGASTASTASTQAATKPGTNNATNTGVKFSLLPSFDLQYDTFFNGAQNQSGTIHWRTDGRTYELVVSVPLPFIGTYSYTSRGHIDAFGLAPDVYIEQRGRRGTDFSRFDRTNGPAHVAFTRTPQTVAIPDGAQDRFSMIFQLAGLVRGNPAQYTPGVTREFFVVDDDSGENWPIQTMGPDRVLRADGPLDAWHFMRLPRHPGDRRRIDVWLAPSLNWLPVRIMQTEPNGTQVELVLRSGTRTSSLGAVSQQDPPGQTGARIDTTSHTDDTNNTYNAPAKP